MSSYIVCWVSEGFINNETSDHFTVFADKKNNYKKAKHFYNSLKDCENVYSINLTAIVKSTKWYPTVKQKELS
tara:strand:+ start:1930 stop:2148 length:219 start_codon:yes stop_codon:yes gene_type:complete